VCDFVVKFVILQKKSRMVSLTNINKSGGEISAPRQSNFELLRIVAMLLVLVVHADFFSLGCPDDVALIHHPVSSLMRYVVETLAVVCVNVYILISGYFGIRLSFKRVAGFVFMFMFWRVFVSAVMYGMNVFSDFSFPICISQVIRWIVPGYDDWFVGAYILLMFFSPFLNSYIEVSSCRRIWIWTILYVGFQICFSWLTLCYLQFANGYSVLSFIGLYMLGAAIRKSRQTLGRSALFSITCYVLTAVTIGVLVFLTARYMAPSVLKTRILGMFGSYNGAVVMACCVFLFLGFKHIKLQSRLINRIAASAFAVYLFHMHPAMRAFYKEACCFLFDNFNTPVYILLISAFILCVFFFAIGIDQVRKKIWDSLWALYVSLQEKLAVMSADVRRK